MNQALLVFLALPLSALLTLICGRYGVEMLRRLKLGQYIREEGPQSHQSKGGTPTMGGILFLLPVILTTLLFSQQRLHALICLGVVLLITSLGLYDDLQKILLKNNKGITPKQKLAGQVLIGALLGLYLIMAVPDFTPQLEIPFTAYRFQLSGWAYLPFLMFFFTATTNAVNLTDGLDGLASTIAILSLGALVAMLLIQGGLQSLYLQTGLVMGLATIGGCIGFLWFNAHPAQVFMGDTGSLALGGIISVIAAMGHLELWFAIVGLIFVAEALSVMIQVAWFKRTKKRIFRMSPLHHHYELGGWKETQVVNRFAIVAFFLAFVSVLSYAALHGVF